jgi:2,5-diamino-6-(ribosylamino)-4(3H)-pyrimidinone 5'-phosphate reductase
MMDNAPQLAAGVYEWPSADGTTMTRPETTLFLLTSVDGKISTGDSDVMDVDADYPAIEGIKEGLHQYYAIEQETALFSLNTGRVFSKIGFNDKNDQRDKLPVSFVVLDSLPHLTEQGVSYLSRLATKLIIVTTNASHPAYAVQRQAENIHIIAYANQVDFIDLFQKLGTDYGAEKLTIQSGGTLNATLVRQGLVDRVLLVVAPALVGGKDTSTVMDGRSLQATKDLSDIKALELVQAKPLEDSYVLLEYKVKNVDGRE